MDQNRHFTVDDLKAIRGTRQAALNRPVPWGEMPTPIVKRWHNINDTQAWAVNHLPISDEEVAAKLHLLAYLPASSNIGDVYRVYGLDPAEYEKQYNDNRP